LYGKALVNAHRIPRVDDLPLVDALPDLPPILRFVAYQANAVLKDERADRGDACVLRSATFAS
jgi:hypothetical protein